MQFGEKSLNFMTTKELFVKSSAKLMGYFNKILICLVFLLGAALLTEPGWADQKASKNTSSGSPFISFFNYRLAARDFSPTFSGISKLIERADSLKKEGGDKNGDNQAAKELFLKAAAETEKQLTNVNRAFKDELYFLLGYTLEGAGEEKKALNAYSNSIESRATNLLALFRHAQLLKNSGQCEKAIPEFREVAWRADKLAYEPTYLIGECLLKAGNVAAAEKEFTTAAKQNPNFPPLLRYLIQTQKKLIVDVSEPRRKAELQSQLMTNIQNFLKVAPDDRELSLDLAEFLLNSSDSLFDKNKISHAESLAEKFAASSNYKDVAAVEMLVRAQIKLGDLEGATKSLGKGLAATPESKQLKNQAKQIELESQTRAEKLAS